LLPELPAANTTLPGGGTTPNLLYDPNYRKFDVEGYRIYRGRSDAPNALKLIAKGATAAEKQELFFGTANRFYRLGL
jgi:hypothetical protein